MHRKVFLALQRVKRNAAEIFATLQRVKPDALRPQVPSKVDFGGITFFQGCAALKNPRAKRAEFGFFRVEIGFLRFNTEFRSAFQHVQNDVHSLYWIFFAPAAG